MNFNQVERLIRWVALAALALAAIALNNLGCWIRDLWWAVQ
jgi:hypothetical protein